MKDECEPFLEKLAAELNRRAPLRARVERTVEAALVRVVNPEAGWLTERVGCRREHPAGGEFFFWWEWGPRIGSAEDVGHVAAAVARALTPEP
ncbi:hypothetical protein ACFQ07_25865 [Actinomadura adrarensis]|uniref:Uncharacterized protein n=1 Tax=Actinomadura adrarensis TaxID=1819600 RepID=A0ABW3CMG2_9ACTN